MRDSDKVTGRFGRLRRRQIARPDETVHARPVGAPIAEGGAAFENAGGRLRKKRHDAEAKDAGNAQAEQRINRTAHEISPQKLVQSRHSNNAVARPVPQSPSRPGDGYSGIAK
jgi:hypothetical protein